LQEVTSPETERAGVRLLIKRDDLIHPQFGGNKWRKLKYNIEHMLANDIGTLMTFGGAWSNHIHATAAAGKHFGIDTIGIIRGEAGRTPSDTLQFARHCGMQLFFLDRQQYRLKDQPEVLGRLLECYASDPADTSILPEGGSNRLAVVGCREIVDEIIDEIGSDFEHICCSTGTGATLAGLACALRDHPDPAINDKQATGFCALKLPRDPEHRPDTRSQLEQDIDRHIRDNLQTGSNPESDSLHANWQLVTDYHFGGYARIDEQLVDFMQRFRRQQGVRLDAVYTGKMFYGLLQQIKQGHYKPGTTIVAVHSGGLQGNRGYRQYGL
jgi:1-aminocyclopropane-1-carboxylate deaminase/D-cysteine desulfhydrase-like pyridoxal-dependent ACC family enzyme